MSSEKNSESFKRQFSFQKKIQTAAKGSLELKKIQFVFSHNDERLTFYEETLTFHAEFIVYA